MDGSDRTALTERVTVIPDSVVTRELDARDTPVQSTSLTRQ